MRKSHLSAAFAAAILATGLGATSAGAQTVDWPLGAELRGATVRVELANGVTNTVQFYPDGTAAITGRSGQVVNGNWWAESNQLCLQAAGKRECWPYQTAFQNNRTVTLTSDCAATSRWTASGIQQPQQQRAGERG